MKDSDVLNLLKAKGFSDASATKALSSFKLSKAENPEDYILDFGGEGKTRLLAWLNKKVNKTGRVK